LPGPVLQLYTPPSAAFYARTVDGFQRSDDGGSTWSPRSLPVPPGYTGVDRLSLAVTPADHDVLFAAAPDGLYASGDGARSWQVVWLVDGPAAQGGSVVVSPADFQLVYMAIRRPEGVDVLRSRNRGADWDPVDRLRLSGGGPCGWTLTLFAAHPADTQRAFRTAACAAGRDLSLSLSHTTDQGATWSRVFSPSRGYPELLVGGAGAAPTRYYLVAMRRGPTEVGGHLFRSDDDGANWRETRFFDGALVNGLSYDPTAPDRVYVGLGRGGNSVLGSTDRGTTWTDLGLPDGSSVNDVALGIDGRNLYAATDTGLWRLPLP